jgi:hypothetical protein
VPSNAQGFAVRNLCGDSTRLRRRLRGVGTALVAWPLRPQGDARGMMSRLQRVRTNRLFSRSTWRRPAHSPGLGRCLTTRAGNHLTGTRPVNPTFWRAQGRRLGLTIAVDRLLTDEMRRSAVVLECVDSYQSLMTANVFRPSRTSPAELAILAEQERR